MLKKITDPCIREEAKTYGISGDVQIYAKTLYKENEEGKTAIFIHGGGSGGNHTIVARAAYWIMHKGLSSRMILPDRRGAGLSSPMNSVMTFEDHARDMCALLDGMGISGKVTAIGISYGGPIALTLAGMDSRIDEVILVASSPSLKEVKGLWGFMYRHHMITPVVRMVYKKYIGKLPPVYPDFDSAYDVKSMTRLKKLFLEKIMQMPKERFESLMLENDSTCNLDNQCIGENIRLDIPVYRVIGTKDETWEVDVGDKYKEQIPGMKTVFVDGATHKDVFFRAQEFYEALYRMMKPGGAL